LYDIYPPQWTHLLELPPITLKIAKKIMKKDVKIPHLSKISELNQPFFFPFAGTLAR
jgi:hypothetical protein